jgi:hypothetical protein
MDKLRSAINTKLPGELQEVVWKKYFNSFVCYEVSLYRNEINTYETMYDKYCKLLDNLIQTSLDIYNRSEPEFNITLDFLEDRLFDDVYNVDGIGILLTLKHYIKNPYALKIELQTQCNNDYEYSRIPSKLEYKNAYQFRLYDLERKINNISTVYYMLQGRYEETDDDEYIDDEF